MPVITRIAEQKRRPNRHSIYIDGTFSFGCNVTVVARFRLREGLALDVDAIQQIISGEVKQACFDSAMRFITMRLHSRSELQRKLVRQDWGGEVIDLVLADLTRLGYLDDARFAQVKAESAATHKRHGRQRARLNLLRAGVSSTVADSAVAEVYQAVDSVELARQLALKQLPRLQRLDVQTAKRRLVAMLQRRGFEYESIRPVVDQLLGRDI